MTHGLCKSMIGFTAEASSARLDLIIPKIKAGITLIDETGKIPPMRNKTEENESELGGGNAFSNLEFSVWCKLVTVIYEKAFSGSYCLSAASRHSSGSLTSASFIVLLVAIPLVIPIGVIPRCVELSGSVARVWSVGKGRAITIVATSESVGRPPVTVDHPPGVARSTTRHPTAVVEGLRLSAEAGPLLRRLLLMASGLFLGMEGTDYRLQLFRLQLRLLGGMLRLAAEGLVVTVLVLAGRVQSLCLASRRDRGVEVKDRLHGLEWCCVHIDAAAVRSFGDGLEHLRLSGGGERRGGGRLLRGQRHGGLDGVDVFCWGSRVRRVSALVHGGRSRGNDRNLCGLRLDRNRGGLR